MNWVDMADEYPATGEPVLITNGDTVQNLVYMREECEEPVRCWFEPYGMPDSGEDCIDCSKPSHWIYVDEIPKPKQRAAK